MTSKLTITRARLEEIRDYDTCVTLEESAELARMALAAMDSEPVYQCQFYHTDAYGELELHWEDVNQDFYEQWDSERRGYRRILYRHAQPAQISALKLPPKLSNDRERSYELNTGVDTWNRCIDEVAKINGEMILAGRVDGLHPSTVKLVNDFATALAEKLLKAELKYGYSNAWTNNGWMTECLADFHRHIAKGDPRDVAAYCAFMWYHGWKTEAAQPAPVVPDYFASLVAAARVRADKAIRKFPQPNYVLNKVAEESGEVIKAVIHYTEGREEWSNVEAEIIDNLAMLLRLVKEGDQVIGFTPPVSCRAAMFQAGNPVQPELTVWYGSMPESNGKSNWTAILHRKGEGKLDGMTIDRSEYPGRVLYAADRVRYLIGEKPDRPYILDYDGDKHSGYVAPKPAPVMVSQCEQCGTACGNSNHPQRAVPAKSEHLQRAEKLAEDAAALVERVGGANCEWESDDNGVWHGSCGVEWQFFDDGPRENGQNFCPGCGKPTSIKQ